MLPSTCARCAVSCFFRLRFDLGWEKGRRGPDKEKGKACKRQAQDRGKGKDSVDCVYAERRCAVLSRCVKYLSTRNSLCRSGPTFPLLGMDVALFVRSGFANKAYMKSKAGDIGPRCHLDCIVHSLDQPRSCISRTRAGLAHVRFQSSSSSIPFDTARDVRRKDKQTRFSMSQSPYKSLNLKIECCNTSIACPIKFSRLRHPAASPNRDEPFTIVVH